MTLSSSLGLPKKLIRIRDNPEVAVAYHAREHTPIDRGQYVLVQGVASFDPKPDREWLDSITPEWERFLGPKQTGLLERWLDVYYWQRVAIEIEVRRVLSWPTRRLRRRARGLRRAAARRSRRPRRARRARARRRASRPRACAARPESSRTRCSAGSAPTASRRWCPVAVTGADEQARRPGVGRRRRGSRPGGRRAGLTAHAFKPRMVGQEQRVHTGWLEHEGGRIRYSPHTRAGYALPASKAIFVAGAAIGTRSGIRKARAAGLA